MQPRIYWIVACAALVFVGCNAGAANEKEPSGKERSPGGSNYNSYPDDIYLDDQDALEGSGRGGGEVRDDLEASGSGLGPDVDDDEDRHRNDFNKANNRIETVAKPAETNPPYIEDPHKTKHTNQDLAPKREESDVDVISRGVDEPEDDENSEETHVLIMNPKQEDHGTSFFAQPGVLAAVIGGAVVGLLCAILVVMFIVYRMRKKDEGSYALDEPRRSPAAAAYPKAGAPHHNREFYA